jgi:DNA-binding PadR family transcriptional regulator
VTALGLTVLRLLCERDMHPYEMQQRIRERGLDQLVKVTHGALYHTVESLTKAELIVSAQTTREGRRPERTVYAVTEAGRDVALDRLRQILGMVTPEYPAFRVALAFMSMMSPADAAERLGQRAVLLEGELASVQTHYDALVKNGLARIALVEFEHMASHLRADLELTRGLLDDIREGRLTWDNPESKADK